jgi:hypothetical protein
MSDTFRREVTLHSMEPSAIEATKSTIEMLSAVAPDGKGLTLTVEGDRAFLVAETAPALDFACFAVKHQGYVKSVALPPEKK